MLSPILLIAFLGGIVPTLLWLFFWLMEDKCEPEPKRYIFFCFLAGGLVVIPVYFIEQFATSHAEGARLLLLWAAAEELMKFLAAYIVALRAMVFDEPLDAVVYLITVALGFSAIENGLFLLGPLQDGQFFSAIVTENLRFIGATLLHVLCSGIVGLALAFSFYSARSIRIIAALGGVVLAIALHTLFNFFILNSSGAATFWIFFCIWVGIAITLLSIERIKQPVRDYC